MQTLTGRLGQSISFGHKKKMVSRNLPSPYLVFTSFRWPRIHSRRHTTIKTFRSTWCYLITKDGSFDPLNQSAPKKQPMLRFVYRFFKTESKAVFERVRPSKKSTSPTGSSKTALAKQRSDWEKRGRMNEFTLTISENKSA